MMKTLRLFVLVALVSLPLFVMAQETQFVPLTSVPGVEDFKQSPNLAAFLNNIYMIAIGVAAALAVFQIIRAGIGFMTNKGSISENEQSRHLLQMSVLGLLLVLSPVIVFGIINPDILKLNFAVDELGLTYDQVPANISSVTLWTNDTLPRAEAEAKCKADGGTAQFNCVPPGGTAYTVSPSQQCPEGEKSVTQCIKQDGFDAQCKEYSSVQASGSGLCDGSKGYKQIAASCCKGMSAGSVCCGKNTNEQIAQLSASAAVDAVFGKCLISLSSSQKSCLVTGLTPPVGTLNQCLLAGTNKAACVAPLTQALPGIVSGCVALTSAQSTCVGNEAAAYVNANI